MTEPSVQNYPSDSHKNTYNTIPWSHSIGGGQDTSGTHSPASASHIIHTPFVRLKATSLPIICRVEQFLFESIAAVCSHRQNQVYPSYFSDKLTTHPPHPSDTQA